MVHAGEAGVKDRSDFVTGEVVDQCAGAGELAPAGSSNRILPFLGLVAAGSVPFWTVGSIAADPSLGLPVNLDFRGVVGRSADRGVRVAGLFWGVLSCSVRSLI